LITVFDGNLLSHVEQQ